MEPYQTSRDATGQYEVFTDPDRAALLTALERRKASLERLAVAAVASGANPTNIYCVRPVVAALMI